MAFVGYRERSLRRGPDSSNTQFLEQGALVYLFKESRA